MSKVYSRHHVPSERIPIVRKNNKSVSDENIQDPDVSNKNDSKVLPSTSNDLLQVAKVADSNANQEPKTALPDEPISNDAHVCAKDAQAEGTQSPSSFDGESDCEVITSSDNDMQLTHPSVLEAPSTETYNTFGSNSDEVDDTGSDAPDTCVSDVSLIEHTSDDNNALTDEDNGSTVTHPDNGETPPQKGEKAYKARLQNDSTREAETVFAKQEVSLSDNLGMTPIFDLLTSCNTRWLALSFQTPTKFDFKDL